MSKVLIKKYANRRLYNMSSGCYIVYGELVEMIKEGIKVKIIDVQTGIDITIPIIIHALADHLHNLAYGQNECYLVNKDNSSKCSDIVQGLIQTLLNNSDAWLIQYAELINNYLNNVQYVYKNADKKQHDHIGSFIKMQELCEHNRAFMQGLMDLAQQHFN